VRKVVVLDVGAPFHCSLMGEVEAAFRTELEAFAFREPRLPVVANVTADRVRVATDAVDGHAGAAGGGRRHRLRGGRPRKGAHRIRASRPGRRFRGTSRVTHANSTGPSRR
jgi:[acyl-carrier-protein] S-malonyltransferase